MERIHLGVVEYNTRSLIVIASQYIDPVPNHVYADVNPLAIVTEIEKSGERHAVFSVNAHSGEVDNGEVIYPNEFVVNHDVSSKFLEVMMNSGLFEDTMKRVNYGYVTGAVVLRLTGPTTKVGQ